MLVVAVVARRQSWYHRADDAMARFWWLLVRFSTWLMAVADAHLPPPPGMDFDDPRYLADLERCLMCRARRRFLRMLDTDD